MISEYRGPFEEVGAGATATSTGPSVTTTTAPATTPATDGGLATSTTVESVPKSPVDAFFEQTNWKREDVELVLNALSVLALLAATYWKVSA